MKAQNGMYLAFRSDESFNVIVPTSGYALLSGHPFVQSSEDVWPLAHGEVAPAI